ncbi:MAG TPA: SH3 domain-containing protein [Thiobacillus sp.]|nr:SH3 domain-containing protein [Thiobacillus sp.]
MKPEAMVLIVSFAAVLGACGDRSEEAGAPVSEPAAPRVDSATPPAVAEAPAAPASEPAADAAQTTIVTPSAVAKAPSEAAPGPAAAAPPAAPPAAVSSAPGTVLRAEKLYREPASTSKVTASVAKGARVEILGKQAGWLRVKAGSQSGWIRLLSVRAGSGGLGGAGVGDVVGAATTRSDPTRVVAVAGLRGLNDEDLKEAKFNAEELARLDALRVSATQARTFAGQARLAAVSVPDLPKPQAQQSSTWESN